MISTQREFNELVRKLASHPEIAVDCEFHGEGRYRPRLCLVQLGYSGEGVVVDPLCVDLSPLREVLESESVVKLCHAPEQDIQLLAAATGGTIRNVFDTQIAAAFVGYGISESYATLVESICDVKLSKASRLTNWLARPLTLAQITYAVNDVRYLPQVAAALRNKLIMLDRFAWATTAMSDMVAKALAGRDRSRLYLRIGPLKTLSSRQLAVLRELAVWRDRRAEETDRPPRSVVADEALLQIAVEPPGNAAELVKLRGCDKIGKGAEGVMKAIEAGRSVSDADCPPVVADRDERTDSVAAFLGTALRVRANQLQIAPLIIANREQIEALVTWYFAGRPEPAPEVVTTGGWRRAAAGDLLLSCLEGQQALRVNGEASLGVIVSD